MDMTDDLDQDVLGLIQLYEAKGSLVAVQLDDGQIVFRYNGMFPKDLTWLAASLNKWALHE